MEAFESCISCVACSICSSICCRFVCLDRFSDNSALRRTIRLNEKAGPGPDKNETKYTREYVPGRGTTISESVPGGPESGLARIDRTTLYDAHGQRIAHTEKKLDTRGNFTVSSQGPAGNASSIGHETWGTKWTATTRQRPAGQPSYELHVANALEGQFTLTAKPTVAGLALELFANGLSDATIAGQPFSTPLKHFIPGKLLEILPPQIDGLPATMLQSLHDAF